MKEAAVVIVVLWVVLSLAAGCGASAPTPTPTPEPTPTPVWILATKPEHLVGTWYNPGGIDVGMGAYYQFEADGTVKRGETLEQLQETPFIEGRCWFEDGIYYEEGQMCEPIASYRVFLQVEGSRAVALRYEQIDDSDPWCWERSRSRRSTFVRLR